jgi:NADP-dependent 3-hydroxy acid dehydrogenase YdfG
MSDTNDGKRMAVVTGAGRASGIGYEVSRQLGQAGMTVVLTGRDGVERPRCAGRGSTCGRGRST